MREDSGLPARTGDLPRSDYLRRSGDVSAGDASALALCPDPCLCGDRVPVAFPVPVGALVLPPADGAGRRPAQHPAGAADPALQADAAARHDRAAGP